jgi:hypothetical protein
MNLRALSPAVVIAFAVEFPCAALASIAVAPGESAAFNSTVATCMSIYPTADASTKDFIAKLEASPDTVTIKSAPPFTRSQEYADVDPPGTNPCGLTDAGQPGTGLGVGSTVEWDYTNTHLFLDAVPRDPCSELVHELYHAFEDATGVTMNNASATGLEYTEADATKAENRYRASQGLPQRTGYPNAGVLVPLPPDGDPLCASGGTCCSKTCTDVTSSASNCGTCGTTCSSGQACSGGTCACNPLTCAGRTCCASGCVDTNTDYLNCGACGHACATGQVCQIGVCVTGWQCGYGYCPLSYNGCELGGGSLYSNAAALCFVGPNLGNWICPTGYYECPTLNGSSVFLCWTVCH